MSWSLQISIPRPKYKVGDTVSGFVRLVSQYAKGQDVDVGSITIEFTGTSTAAKHWPRIPNAKSLFSLKMILFSGPERLHAPHHQAGNTDRNEWPFSFTLPLDCSASQRESSTSSSYFNSDPNQPLPISFVDDNVQDGSCSILYELQATLVSPSRDGYYTNEGCIKKAEISVYRPRNIDQPNPIFHTKIAAFAYQSLTLLPREERQLVHRPLTIKQKLKLRPPSTEHLPKAVFEVRVETPSAAVISRPLPLMLHVKYNVNASTTPRPIFHLSRVTIHLCKETSICGLRRAGGYDSTRWTKEITLQEQEFQTRRPRVEQHLDLRKVMDTIVHDDLTPTFKTFNIARTYSLKVFVRLECGGKEHLVFGDYKPCTLLAKEYDPQMAAYSEPAPVMVDVDNDPPPPYDLVAQEAVPGYSTQTQLTNQHEHGRNMQNGAELFNADEHPTATTSDTAATPSFSATT